MRACTPSIQLGSLTLTACMSCIPSRTAEPNLACIPARNSQILPLASMPRPKRDLHAVAQETESPPDSLADSQSIARVKQAAGNNLYHLELPGGKAALAELQARFRSTVWIKRGSYVLLDTAALADRDNKLDGEIVNVIRGEKAWRKMAYWPKEFSTKASSYPDDSDDEGPRMPSSDSEED